MGRHVMKIANEALRNEALDLVRKSPIGTRLEFSRNIRSHEQNDRMWAMLTEVSRKATLQGKQFDAEDWKTIFMVACGKELRLAPALEGPGFVPLGVRSSKLTIQEMSDLMEFISAWCAEQEIQLTDPRYEDRSAA